MYALGIDIGGTKIAGARVAPDGAIVDSFSLPTTPHDVDNIVATVGELVGMLSTPDTVDTVGVAVAAFLDKSRDTIFFAPNIDWRDFPIKARLQATLGRSVRVENDANAAGWGEFSWGAARSAQSMMMLTMGTGVGGALVEDGRLLTGGFGSAGELGHIIIEPGGRLCGCGNQGCLEQYASGTALMRQAREATKTPDLSPADLTALVQAGDAIAMEVLTDVCAAMGRGIASLVAVTDPEIVVIGGGVADAGPLVTELITASFHATYGPVSRRPIATIVPATLGNTAGMVGAAELARASFLESA